MSQERKNVLLERLSYLAESWGGKVSENFTFDQEIRIQTLFSNNLANNILGKWFWTSSVLRKRVPGVAKVSYDSSF